MLEEIFARQQSYRSAFGSYCLNGRSAGNECNQHGFDPLGVFWNPEDCYCYRMESNIDTFVCHAWADIDQKEWGWLWDEWTINQDHQITHIDDIFDMPFIPGTEYSWKIVARDSHGNETESPVWRFTTVADTSGVR
jgi:hypothetical protein